MYAIISFLMDGILALYSLSVISCKIFSIIFVKYKIAFIFYFASDTDGTWGGDGNVPIITPYNSCTIYLCTNAMMISFINPKVNMNDSNFKI